MNVLLSIKPEFAYKIVNGHKKYEFRRVIFKRSKIKGTVYIYASSPVKKIIGTFKIEDVIEDKPEALWARFKEEAGIEKEMFFEYFKEREKGFAIKIKEVKAFDPTDPKTIKPNFVPPQSFSYIDDSQKTLFGFLDE